jgi:hypothetical protein
VSNYLDKIGRSGKKSDKPSAASLPEISKRLPSQEEEYKRAEQLTSMFDNTSRAGAGGTKAGSFGIRPSGGKAATEFLDNYTGTGRHKPKPELLSEPVKMPTRGIQHSFKPPKVIFPANFCPDCGRTDRPKELPVLNVTMLGPQQKDVCSSIGIDPFDVILSVFCQECMKKAYAAGKVDERNELSQPIVMPDGTIEYETPSQGYLRKRKLRIVDHMIEYMRSERVKGDSPIFRNSGDDN